MESMFARHLCLTLLRAITVQSPTATHTGKEIFYTILPPPRIAKVRHPVPVRPLGAGRSRRARNDHQGLIKLRARTSALTLSRPSSALPSVYISKVQCPLQDPVPLIDLPTAFRPKPSIAHDGSSSGINLRNMSRGTTVLPQSAPPHSPTTPRTRVPDPNTTAQSPRTPTNRLPPHVPYTPAAPSVECEFLRNLTSRSKLLSYPDTHASVHSSMHHIDSRSTHAQATRIPKPSSLS